MKAPRRPVASSRVMYVSVSTLARAGQVTTAVDMGRMRVSLPMGAACSGLYPVLRVFLTTIPKSLWGCMCVWGTVCACDIPVSVVHGLVSTMKGSIGRRTESLASSSVASAPPTRAQYSKLHRAHCRPRAESRRCPPRLPSACPPRPASCAHPGRPLYCSRPT
jgi:hypothetical protein